MKVKFESIFWRQASAALLATVTYSLICGDITAAIGPLFMFFWILAVQEWAIDKIIGRRKHRDYGYRDEAGRSRKSA